MNLHCTPGAVDLPLPGTFVGKHIATRFGGEGGSPLVDFSEQVGDHFGVGAIQVGRFQRVVGDGVEVEVTGVVIADQLSVLIDDGKSRLVSGLISAPFTPCN